MTQQVKDFFLFLIITWPKHILHNLFYVSIMFIMSFPKTKHTLSIFPNIVIEYCLANYAIPIL